MNKKLIVMLIVISIIFITSTINMTLENLDSIETNKTESIREDTKQTIENSEELNVENSNLVIKNITDKTTNMSDFSCLQALDVFYEDNKYKYYYTCMRSQYIIVEYTNGMEETIKIALKNGHIKITDLDKYNIHYLKKEKLY